jgi:hypothetical protein
MPKSNFIVRGSSSPHRRSVLFAWSNSQEPLAAVEASGGRKKHMDLHNKKVSGLLARHCCQKFIEKPSSQCLKSLQSGRLPQGARLRIEAGTSVRVPTCCTVRVEKGVLTCGTLKRREGVTSFKALYERCHPRKTLSPAFTGKPQNPLWWNIAIAKNLALFSS